MVIPLDQDGSVGRPRSQFVLHTTTHLHVGRFVQKQIWGWMSSFYTNSRGTTQGSQDGWRHGSDGVPYSHLPHPPWGTGRKRGWRVTLCSLTNKCVLAAQSLPPVQSTPMSLEPSTEPDTQLWMCECGVCVAGDYEGVRGVSVCETCVSVREVRALLFTILNKVYTYNRKSWGDHRKIVRV